MPAADTVNAAGGEPLRGRFIVLVGPDGVGKTAVASELVQQRGGRYFHFRPPLRARDLRRSPPSDGGHKVVHDGPFLLGPLRLLRTLVMFWLGYFGSVRPTLMSGIDVVADRWAYGYLVQPKALKYSGPEKLAKLVVSLLPSPDLVVNLAAEPETVRRRKPELSIEDIAREQRGWKELSVDNFVTLDAEPAVRLVVDQLSRHLSG